MTGHPAGWPVSAAIVCLLLNRLSLTFISATYPPIISSRCLCFFVLIFRYCWLVKIVMITLAIIPAQLLFGGLSIENMFLTNLVRLELNIRNLGKFFSSFMQILNHLFLLVYLTPEFECRPSPLFFFLLIAVCISINFLWYVNHQIN